MGTVEKVVAVKNVAKVERGAVPTLAGVLNLLDMEVRSETAVVFEELLLMHCLIRMPLRYYSNRKDTHTTHLQQIPKEVSCLPYLLALSLNPNSSTAKIWNNSAYDLIRFRPRVLVDVEQADLSTTILGRKSSLPLFIAPAAMGRLAHPDGEKCLARVAEEFGFPYIVNFSYLIFLDCVPEMTDFDHFRVQVSANSSIGFEDLVDKTSSTQTLFYQVSYLGLTFTLRS